MGTRGPRPQPGSSESIRGRNTLSRRPRPPAEALVVEPEHVAARALASVFWHDHAGALIASGRLRPELVESFAILCHLFADCRQLATQLAEEGWITATDKGQAASPVARLLRDARRDYLTYAKEFGMTAAADSRLPQDATDGKEETSREEALLARLKVRHA